jgi:hypothetical protein
MPPTSDRVRKIASSRVVVPVLLGLICFLVTSRAEEYIIAYLPWGGESNPRIVLTNPNGEPSRVQLRFFTQNGQEISELTGPRLNKVPSSLEIGPRAVETLELGAIDRAAPQIIWAVAETSGPLQIVGSFGPALTVRSAESAISAIGPPFGRPVPPTEPPGKPTKEGPGRPTDRPPVSVPGTVPRLEARISSMSGVVALPSGTQFRVPISIDESQSLDAALAIANPGAAEARVSIRLVQPDGLGELVRVLQIPSRGQIGAMLTDPAWFQGSIDSRRRFDGSVTICSDQPVGILAIGIHGDFAYSLPVASGSQCGSQGLP